MPGGSVSPHPEMPDLRALTDLPANRFLVRRSIRTDSVRHQIIALAITVWQTGDLTPEPYVGGAPWIYELAVASIHTSAAGSFEIALLIAAPSTLLCV